MDIQCVRAAGQKPEKHPVLKKALLMNGLVVCVFYQNVLYARNWHITPSLQLQGIYSDNITLAPGANAKSAFVTSLSPAANIIWQAGKSSLNLRYNMQNLYNAHGDGDYNLAHQLQFNAHNVVAQNRFFVDSRASVSQQNISNRVLVGDNISGAADSTTTVSSFGISPYWVMHLGNYANATVRVNADRFSSGASDKVSDSETVSESVQLNSGSKFKRVSWSAGFNNSQSFRSGGEDVSFQSSNATLRTYIGRHFSLFATVGHSENQFTTRTNNSRSPDGFFYTFGGRWAPSSYYWLEAGGGNNSYATVSISPMKRLSWLTTVRHNTVGLNSGTTWQMALNYRTRRSNWSLSHDNDTTTVQDILSRRNIVNNLVGTGSDIPGLNISDIDFSSPSLLDDVVVRESWNLSATFYTGKSTVLVNAFNQDRKFQGSLLKGSVGSTEHIRGINAVWNWQFARKTSAYLRPQWQQIERKDTGGGSSHDDRYDFSVGLNQAINNRINGQLEFRHVTQNSGLSANDYQENRVTANLLMRY